MTQNPIKSLAVLLQSFQIAEINKGRYITYLEEKSKNQQAQISVLKKKNIKLENKLAECQDIIAHQDKTIKKLELKKSRSRDIAHGYAPVNSRNLRDKNYASLTPNRTITSLDSLSSAANDMDSILNGLVEGTRKSSKRNVSKRSHRERKSRKSKNICNPEAHEVKKRKRNMQITNFDETISKDSECSPKIFRHRNFKIK